MYQLQTKTVTLNLHILNLFYLIFWTLSHDIRSSITISYAAYVANSDCAFANGYEAYCVGEKTLLNK